MGRKTSFLAASLIYLVAGPAAAFVYHFPAFLFLRVALGAAGSGVFNAAYMISKMYNHTPFKTHDRKINIKIF